MKKNLMAAYGVLALFGFSLLAWIIPANTEDSGSGLSPALLPNILAALILGLSSILLYQTWRSRNTEPSTIAPRHLLRLAAFFLIFFAAFPLMRLAGFFPGAVVTLLLLQLMCGQRSIPRLLGISLGLAGVTWGFMVHVVQVPLP